METPKVLKKFDLFVDGRGKVWGKYVITRLSEDQSRHMSDGAPRKITFSMTLKRYGGDDG